ncbi:MAG: hypothetical protein CUN49_01785 [Candidatus Thermofonsia Clade 1 bacterium]|uniref:Uncharacterized protein n=1 Tax=Candidatus Thermofonsia Clade 1 bacterium TaxID=2364210 RepID=A0A2M8PHW6_9CHLR|nr:MAG: hypothetical protein CUN49_01785 [Candidatus Thermofonsia Clade 1 bacterium]
MRHQSAPLRLIALRLGVAELETVVGAPNVVEGWRLTIHHHDGRAPDQIATWLRLRGQDVAHMTTVYRRASEKPLTLTHLIPAERYQAFLKGARQLNFDKMDDPPSIPWIGADLWLLERAAGGFHHDVILVPDRAEGAHAALIALLRDQLKEALRAVNA